MVRKYSFVLLGAHKVGKTTMCIQVVGLCPCHYGGDYNFDYDDVHMARKMLDDQKILLEMWDTVDQEDLAHAHVIDGFVRRSHGAMLVYSVTDRASFEKLTLYKRYLEVQKPNPAFPIVLVGTKIDLEEKREVSTEEGRRFAQEVLGGSPFAELDIHQYSDVVDAFVQVARVMKQRREEAAARRQEREAREARRKNQRKNLSHCVLL